MLKFYINYPDTMAQDTIRCIQGRLRSNIRDWLKQYRVNIANIEVDYREKEYSDKVDHEFIISFELEPECYGGPNPSYYNACRVQIAKFGEDIIVYHKYKEFLDACGMQPNAYHFEEV